MEHKKEYLEFAKLCLHSESISNIHYVKYNIGKEQENVISGLMNIIGSPIQSQVNKICNSVKSFLLSDPDNLEIKIQVIENLIKNWNSTTNSTTTIFNNNNNNFNNFNNLNIQIPIIPENNEFNLHPPPLIINEEEHPNQEIIPVRHSNSPYWRYLNLKTNRFMCPHSLCGCRADFSSPKNIPAHLIICKYKNQPPLKKNKF